MQAANKNDYGITHTAYATDMTEAGPLRYQLDKAGKPYQETALNMGTFLAEPARIVTYESKELGVPVSVLIIPLVGADSWCEEYYSMVGTDHETALARDWHSIIRRARDLVAPDTRRKAYRVTYVIEDEQGNVEDFTSRAKYYSTLGPTDDRSVAVAYAQGLTDDADEENGTFTSAWFRMAHETKDTPRRRVIATVTEMLYEDVPDA